jgi:hypothetical protein
VPKHVINAVLAAEDKRFYQHCGHRLPRTSRAIANAVTQGHITSGASTITQQLVKISRTPPAHAAHEGYRSRDCAAHRAGLVEGPDPARVSESRRLRQPEHRHRGGAITTSASQSPI